ncbi:hypothetical protein [Nitrospirillum iridis]|uniref:Uncharacterized protein n=1 Tax=Nitrospirillum iridis TaxID=765888 RepID=A0A7X0AVC9_9PROT|nr:hypothetical protein [Nitrospirillum iridis]MBB6250760.1 hypothetical protein [Nitrospirillum iridis]
MSDTPATLPATLPTGPLPDDGLDYVALREEGVRLTQRLSGRIWTDYNFSDPGVTTLEQLCFSLTELSYRALYPIADLLADPRSGQVNLWRQALYPAYAALPTNPVTVDDLRRLVLDRVPHVANVWFTPLTPDQAEGVAGLYDIQLYLTADEDCDCATDRRPVAREVTRVLDRYAAHRALCEDVGRIGVLSRVPTEVSATVLIANEADPAQVQAELLFALGLRLAPEPKRQTLKRYAAGRTTSDIFDGPLMVRGLIDSDQLQPLPTSVAVADLLQVMAALPGVTLVQDLTVRVAGAEQSYGEDDVIAVPEDSLLRLFTGTVAGKFPIRLVNANGVCRPDPDKVQRRLNRLWDEQRRTYDLWAEYREDYGPPPALRRDLAAYTSVQDQFPNVYGVNAYGLPAHSPPPRRGQARQFKGYLMPFDQLMADYFSQLGLIRDLFSPKAGGDATYAWQSLRGIVPDVEPLLRTGYETGLADIVASVDPVAQRQSGFLGFLLSLYAERLIPPANSGRSEDDGVAYGMLVRAQRALLRRMVRATADRNRGFDYRHPARHAGGAGMEIRTRIELDLVSLSAIGDYGQDATPVSEPDRATFGRLVDADQQVEVEERFLPLARFLEDLPEETLAPQAGGRQSDAGPVAAGHPLAGHRVAEPLLDVMADASRYRIGYWSKTVVVVCRDANGRWWVIGEHTSVSIAVVTTHHLLRAVGFRRRLTLVEHTLLRYAQPLTQDDGGYYSFRLTAVLHAAPHEASDTDWRRKAEAVVRQNTPAHIAVECLFLDHEGMRRFREHHTDWIRALTQADPARRAEASLRLQRFLQSRHEPAHGRGRHHGH